MFYYLLSFFSLEMLSFSFYFLLSLYFVTLLSFSLPNSRFSSIFLICFLKIWAIKYIFLINFHTLIFPFLLEKNRGESTELTQLTYDS